jgi:hypothetical protein
MKKHLRLTSLLATAVVGAALVAPGAAHAQTLISGFEGDLSTSLGPSWTSGLTKSFGASGATQGSQAVALTHGTGWTQDFSLDGGPALAALIAGSATFEVDVTTPATTAWRQMFVVMQGAGQGWSQHQFDLAAGATSTAVLNLVSTGIRANAAAGDKGWWQIYLIFQGGDSPASPQVVTTLDNVRVTPVPEPSSAAVGAAALAAVFAAGRRWRRS